MRLAAALLVLVSAALVLLVRSGPAPRPDLRRYDLVTERDLGPLWSRVDQARVPTTEEPDVPEALNAACHRNESIRLAFRQQVEESVQLPESPAAFPASSAVFESGGGYLHKVSVRAARLPGEDIDRLERSLLASPRACDGQVVPASEEEPYGYTVSENAPAAPALGDRSVALRRVITLEGSSADWPAGGESLYLIREGDHAVLLTFADHQADQAATQDSLVRRALARVAERLHQLNS
ncbi:hypothetical protein ACIO3O_14165 [Streptomyces sp. NPDC087440]|uniref:hypothetical protein n=1 Tax=Streptomyces sp. NPDC087440 TaxID=3365790 RepID=UPI0038127881